MPDGTVTDEEDIQTTVNEIEQPPNIQALTTWLYHHDEEWRKTERRQDEDNADIPKDISRGVSIAEWIRKEVEDDKDA